MKIGDKFHSESSGRDYELVEKEKVLIDGKERWHLSFFYWKGPNEKDGILEEWTFGEDEIPEFMIPGLNKK